MCFFSSNFKVIIYFKVFSSYVNKKKGLEATECPLVISSSSVASVVPINPDSTGRWKVAMTEAGFIWERDFYPFCNYLMVLTFTKALLECSEEVPSYLRFVSSSQSQPSLKVLNELCKFLVAAVLRSRWRAGPSPSVSRPLTEFSSHLSDQCHQCHSPCVAPSAPQSRKFEAEEATGITHGWGHWLDYGNTWRHAEDVGYTGFNNLWASKLLPRVKGHSSENTELFRCHSNPHLSIFHRCTELYNQIHNQV